METPTTQHMPAITGTRLSVNGALSGSSLFEAMYLFESDTTRLWYRGAITLVITVVAMKWKARQLLERQSPAYWPSDQNSWQGTEEAFPPCPPGPAPPGPSSSAPFRATHPGSCEPLSDSSACDKAGRKLRQSLCRRHPAIPLAWPVLVRSVEHPLKGLMDWKPPEHRELAYQTLDQN